MLSPEQIAARRLRLGGSDMATVMRQDPVELLRLWEEKTGRREPENLEDNLPVQIGIATEPVNLRWYEKKMSIDLTRCGEVVMHPKHKWLGVTLDAYDEVLVCPVEAKHVGGRENIEVIVDRYQPQLQTIMLCTDSSQCALSVIVGNSQHIVEYIPRDYPYGPKLLEYGEQFWGHVVGNTPPVTLPPVGPPRGPEKIIKDMSTDNQWMDSAFIWLNTRSLAADHETAGKLLKSLMPPDVYKCVGGGVHITRDRSNRQWLREGSGE